MTARIFAYIAHKGGVADDSAAELLAAAKKIDPAAVPDGDRHRLGRGARCRLRQPARFLSPRSGRSRTKPGLSQRRTGPPGAGEGAAAGQHRAGPAQSFRNRSGAGALHQAERRVCVRCGGYRGRRRHQSQSRAPGIRRTGEHACPLRYFLRRGDQSCARARSSRSKALPPAGRSSTNPPRSARSRRDAAIWRPSSPKPAMSISPRNRCWSRSAAAFRSRTMSPSPQELADALGAA